MEQGKVTEVTVTYAQAEVTTAAAIGATTIYLDDVGDFDEGGGQVQIGEDVYDYTTVTDMDDSTDDEPASTITLTTGLLVALELSDKVFLYPLTEEKFATVSTPAADDALRCRIPQSLQMLFDDGVREEFDQESVWIELDPDRGWYIKDVAASQQVQGSAVSPVGLPQGNDGLPPSYAPVIGAIGGIRSVLVTVEPIANADPVAYEYHVSAVSGPVTAGDAATMVHVGPETGYLVRKLADGSDLTPDNVYYFHVFAKDADGYGPISEEAFVSPIQVNSPDIAAEAITGDHIFGNTITADKFSAVLAMVSELYIGDHISIKPADSAPGADDSGIKINLSNGGYIHFPSDGSAAELIKVIARFTQVTVEDNMEILGINNRVGGALTLDKNIPPPSTAPSAQNVQDPSAALTVPLYQGLGDNGVSWQRGRHAAYDRNTGVSTYEIRNINKATGADTLAWSNALDFYSVVLDNPHGGGGPAPTPTLISFCSTAGYAVSSWYLPAYTTWYLDDTTLQKVYTTTPARYWIIVVNNATGAITTSVQWPGAVSTYYLPAVFTDGANIWVAASQKVNGAIAVFKYAMTMGAIISSVVTAVYTSRNMTGLYVGNADYGSLRYLFTFGGSLPGASGIVVHDGAAFKNDEDWSVPSSEYATGILYSGGRFWVPTSAGKLRRFNTVKVDTARAVKYTWHNIAGNIKSTASLVLNFTQNARLWFQVNTAAVPLSSDVQAPDSVLIYIDAHEQAALAAGVTTATYDVPTTGGGDSPAADGFAAISTYGLIQSEAIDGASAPLVDIRGTGEGRLGPYHWINEELPAANLYKSSAQSGSATSLMVNYNGVRWLHGGMVQTAGGVIQVPRTGWYQIDANCMWAASTSSARRIFGIGLNTDGSSTLTSAITGTSIAFTQPAAAIVGQVATALLYLAANQYVGAWFNSAVGFALDVSSSYFNHFSIAYVGGS